MLPGGGATRTVKLVVVVELRLPEVPVIVTAAVPVGAEPLTVIVRTLVEEVFAGLNNAVTPVGNPDAARLTLPEKPCEGIILIVLDPLAECCSVTLAGVDESLKLGTGG